MRPEDGSGPDVRATYALLIMGVLTGSFSGCATSASSGKTGTNAIPITTSTSVPTTTSTSAGEEDNVAGPGAPTVGGTVTRPGSGSAPGSSACRIGDPLANVYHPNRLMVLQSCLTVSGTVESMRHEDDGDVHFDLALDGAFVHLLTRANTTYQHGWLVVEIVPADEPGCVPGQSPKPATGTYDYGICSGADETAPAVGTHIYATGPYVLDNAHGGWAEVHPAWAISSNSTTSSTPGPTTTSAQTPTVAPAPSGVRIVSVTSPVSAGSHAMLMAEASPGVACTLSVTLPSGAQSQSQGLGPATADGSGTVRWGWQTGSRTTPGTATATVTCGSGSSEVTFQIN